MALKTNFITCIKKAGYPINKEDEIYEKLLNPKYEKIIESTSSAQPQTTEAVASNAGPPPTIPASKIKEMKDFELKVGNADADCRPQKDVDAAFDVQQRYEAAFIQENKALLNQLKVSQG